MQDAINKQAAKEAFVEALATRAGLGNLHRRIGGVSA